MRINQKCSFGKLNMGVSVQEKKSVTGKMILVFVAIGIGVAVIAGAIFGWEYSILGLGVGLGPWIGGYFGNKKAREVDKYREELINGRKRPSTEEDPKS